MAIAGDAREQYKCNKIFYCKETLKDWLNHKESDTCKDIGGSIDGVANTNPKEKVQAMPQSNAGK